LYQNCIQCIQNADKGKGKGKGKAVPLL